MLTFPASIRIHIATKPADFRKGHFGLSGLVKNELDGDPLRDVWVFYNKRRTDVKILWFDHGGLLVAHKKLARGRFKVSIREDGCTARMTAAELAALLEGIDLSGCRRLKRWNPKT